MSLNKEFYVFSTPSVLMDEKGTSCDMKKRVRREIYSQSRVIHRKDKTIDYRIKRCSYVTIPYTLFTRWERVTDRTTSMSHSQKITFCNL